MIKAKSILSLHITDQYAFHRWYFNLKMWKRWKTMWGFVNVLFWIFYKWNFVYMKSIFSKNCLCGINFHYCHDQMRACGSRETLVVTFSIKKSQIFKFSSAINTKFWMQHNSLTNKNLMSGLQENGPWGMHRFKVPSIYASCFWYYSTE